MEAVVGAAVSAVRLGGERTDAWHKRPYKDGMGRDGGCFVRICLEISVDATEISWWIVFMVLPSWYFTLTEVWGRISDCSFWLCIHETQKHNPLQPLISIL